MSTPWPTPDPEQRTEGDPPPGVESAAATGATAAVAADTSDAPPAADEKASSPLARLVLIVAGVLVGIGLIVGIVAVLGWLVGDDDESADAGLTVPPVPPTELVTTAPPAPDTTPAAPATTAASTVTPPATAPATEPASTPATAPVTVATSVPATSAAPATTTAPIASLPSTGATESEVEAHRIAQALADALADGRWDDARALIGNRAKPTDAQLDAAYGGLVRSTVVPARAQPLGGGEYDLRIGFVAHEEGASGPQTSLICAHWDVDTEARTVLRVDFARVRIEPGWVTATDRAGELSTTCATFRLD
jgi:hypothetical protein